MILEILSMCVTGQIRYGVRHLRKRAMCILAAIATVLCLQNIVSIPKADAEDMRGPATAYFAIGNDVWKLSMNRDLRIEHWQPANQTFELWAQPVAIVASGALYVVRSSSNG